MENFSLDQLQQQLLRGTLSCERLVHYYLQNIVNTQELNAYVEVYADEAMDYAKALDIKIKNQPESLGKLFGCVLSVKDLIVHKDHKVSAGSAILSGFESQFTASALDAVLKEDAIIIGRTNCDEFGMGSDNTNSHFGPVRNKIDKSKISGGSSGGAAVSVQADTCLVALGTDTGGSVRQPAAMCGVIGFKPSYGLVSRFGLVAYASSFDQLGIIGRHVSDIDKVMSIVSIYDENDATMYSDGLYPEQEAIKKTSYRIAYFDQAVHTDGIQAEVYDAFNNSVDKLRSMGHEVNKIGFDYLEYLVPCYYILTTAEASSNLSRYDGIRYGYRSPKAKTLQDVYTMSRSEGFGKEVKKRIMLGSFVLSEAYYDAYFSKAQQVRQLIRQKMDEIFENYDFIILPTSPVVAWDIDQKPSDPLAMYMADIYTVLASLTGMPAVSVPNGNNSDNLPFGIQVLAGTKKDKNLLLFAGQI